MSADFGATVDVIVNPQSNAEGETIVNIPLGAVFKFLRETGEWSKEDYVGPVLATKPKDSNEYLDIQLFNRRSIYNIKIKFYKNSGYHRTDNIIMMKASDGTVYGLASNNDYYEQLNLLEEKLKEFVETPLSPLFNSSRTASPLLPDTDSGQNDSFMSDVSSPLKAINTGNIFNPMAFDLFQQNNILPVKQNVQKEIKWHANPCMIPASVYRRAAVPKNASRASSVTPLSMNNCEKLFSSVDGERSGNYQSMIKQNDNNQINGRLGNESPQINPITQRSRLLSAATASNIPPNLRMDAVMGLINFSYVEGVQKGKKISLLEMPDDHLLNVLQDVLIKKPDVKTKLMEKLN
uniref:Uncharacterized protein n=1 Tax=Panagrolaimus sp. PS1159 TaxID=55785 RepID=A0AC35ERU4_9BILA